MENKKLEEKISGLDLIFENFIKPGEFTEEKEVVPGFKIKVKPLNMGDLAIADLVLKEGMSMDTATKMRSAKILSKAILSLNGHKIEGDTEAEESAIRDALYKDILKLPVVVVQKAFEFYFEVSNKRDKFFTDPKQIEEAIENF